MANQIRPLIRQALLSYFREVDFREGENTDRDRGLPRIISESLKEILPNEGERFHLLVVQELSVVARYRFIRRVSWGKYRPF
jgi:hypothetical protein